MKEFFDAIAPFYDREYALTGDASRARLADMLAAIAGRTRVLVLGIGTGRELPALLDAGHVVHGIEIAPAMIAVFERRSRTAPVVCGDFYERLPFPDGSFGAVIALHGTLAHPPDEAALRTLVEEVARVLTTEGVFYIEAPAAEALDRLALERTGPRSFVHRDRRGALAGVALTAGDWRATLAPHFTAGISALGDVEHRIVARRA